MISQGWICKLGLEKGHCNVILNDKVSRYLENFKEGDHVGTANRFERGKNDSKPGKEIV